MDLFREIHQGTMNIGTFHPIQFTVPMYGKFDIIVIIMLHGKTIGRHEKNKFFYQPIPNTYNATVMEAMPCGVCNFSVPHKLLRHLDTGLTRSTFDPEFPANLQTRLRTIRADQHKKVFVDDDFKEQFEISKGYTGWSVLNGPMFLERLYGSDAIFHEIIAYHTTHGPYKSGDHILNATDSRHRVKRSELMERIQSAGYTTPLYLDASCGKFDHTFKLDHQKKLTANAMSRNLAGGKSRKRNTNHV